jgi:hypothetical protein
MANYKNSQYIPSFLKSSINGNRSISLSFADVSGSNFQNQDSFAYNQDGIGLKSTQQLNVDWSKFENHTFFMSAEAKVNLSYEQIINGYPFDGTKEEIENFFTNLTGFDKWVFDRFPKYHGQLHFSGTQTTETSPNLGSYISVKDIAGALFPSLSSNTDAQTSILNPKNGKSLSIEVQIKIPEISTAGTQIVLQKINSNKNHGFSVRLNPTISTTQVEAQFDIFSGSFNLSTSKVIEKGVFNHLCFILDRDSKFHNAKIFNNELLESQTKSNVQIGNLDIDESDLLIGSGSQYYVNSVAITPQQTLSGSMDELRIFHSFRTQKQQQSYAKKAVYPTNDLKLYYKFNEPPPPLSPIPGDITNAIILDSSGNSLHSYVTNFVGNLREDATLDATSNVIYERDDLSPVLFPAHPQVTSLNIELLTSASNYDAENPNIITKLIPRHYLVEGAIGQGLDSAEQNNGDQYGGTGIPGQGELSNVQIMLSLLYIWAKFFDEMKLFLDIFSNLRTIDYDLNESVPNNFLFDIAKYYGFFIPPLFTSSTIEQYVQGENIDPLVKSNENLSLRSVQHELLRRILINLPNVIRSKGTQHSIKSFLRAIGIEPDTSVRFREYGGPTYRVITQARESKSDITSIINFTTSSLVTSPFLSGSRIEAGYPYAEGSFVNKKLYNPHGISNSQNDGLFTSGSWTFESCYKYNLKTVPLLSITQSLARFCVTGSGIQNPGVIANLVGYYDEITPRVSLFLRPGNDLNAPLLNMSLDLPKDGLFGGDIWNVSFGCERNDSINSLYSSSYFLRVGSQNEGEISYLTSTSSYFYEITGSAESPLNSNVFRKIDKTHNTNFSGTFISIGSNQPIAVGTTSTYRFLNNSTYVNSDARSTNFEGRALKLRFWSKALSTEEWTEHLRNYQSLGVENPLTNYNYAITPSGSFEKLRLDSLTKQEILAAASNGKITFLDFSENGMHLTGSGFPIDRSCILPEIISYSQLSPYFDEAITNEKIRVRGYNDDDLIKLNPWASKAPVYEIVRSESPQDDVRFSIDFSLIDSLNKDISNMFSTFESLENYIGNPELVFSPDYPDLEKLRNVYFNRLKSKLNFKAFLEFYSWFDNSISTFIEQLLPRKTVFKGTNFVIESHMLERHKHEYYFNEMYLSQDRKKKDSIFDCKLGT